MKQLRNFAPVILLFVLLTVSMLSCKKETEIQNNPGNTPGLQVKNVDNATLKLPVDSGDIGLIVDTRDLFKKGYTPAYASVIISGSLSSYSDNHLLIDQFTNLAIIRIKKDTLTKDQLTEAAIGPSTVITIFDSQGKQLTRIDESSLPINDKNQYYTIQSQSPAIKRRFSLNPEVPYIVQESEATSPQRKAEVLTFDGMETVALIRKPYIESGDKSQQFYFIPADKNNKNDDSTYYIRTSYTGQNGKYYYLDIYNGYSSEYQLFAYNDDPSSSRNYKFILQQDDSGWVSIKPVAHPALKDISPQFSPYGNGPVAKFRIVSAAIDWSVTDIETKFNQPILPPQKLELAVSSELINCSDGSLSQTLGKDDSRTETTSTSSSEEFQLTTSQNASVSVSTSVTASGSFYGIGVSATVGITGEYSYGRSVTSTQGKTLETSTQVTKTVSTTRNIEVLPKTGVLVYDAVESYPNVKIPFVQMLRVAGTSNGVQLTGEEIVNQLRINQFGGVVTTVGATFVVITIRGTATIDNFMRVQSKATNITSPCSP